MNGFTVGACILKAYIVGSCLAVFWVNFKAWVDGAHGFGDGTYGFGSVLWSLWVGMWWPYYGWKALGRWRGYEP